MPLWLLIAGLFAGFVWWTNERPRTDQPQASSTSAQPPLWGGKALALLLLWRLGPMRSAALMSSFAAAWPSLKHWFNPGAARPAATPQLSREEAARMLDIPSNANREEVEAAYRRLMTRVHPDAGGNAYLAQLINAARDRLVS